MGINRSRPHLLVLVEDGANRDIVNGFLLQRPLHQVQVMPPARGWLNLVAEYEQRWAPQLDHCLETHLLLVLDFDQEGDRRAEYVRSRVAEQHRARVFLLGSRDEPETLRAMLRPRLSLEKIGIELGRSCDEEEEAGLWHHPHLRHNDVDRQRLRLVIRTIS